VDCRVHFAFNDSEPADFSADDLDERPRGAGRAERRSAATRPGTRSGPSHRSAPRKPRRDTAALLRRLGTRAVCGVVKLIEERALRPSRRRVGMSERGIRGAACSAHPDAGALLEIRLKQPIAPRVSPAYSGAGRRRRACGLGKGQLCQSRSSVVSCSLRSRLNRPASPPTKRRQTATPCG
jgi:hypothetical protein